MPLLRRLQVLAVERRLIDELVLHRADMLAEIGADDEGRFFQFVTDLHHVAFDKLHTGGQRVDQHSDDQDEDRAVKWTKKRYLQEHPEESETQNDTW